MDYSFDPECSLENNSTHLAWVAVWKVALILWLCQISVSVWQRDTTSGWQDRARTSQLSFKILSKSRINYYVIRFWKNIVGIQRSKFSLNGISERLQDDIFRRSWRSLDDYFGLRFMKKYTFSMYDSNCHKQARRHDLNRRLLCPKSGSNRDSKSKKCINWCIWGICQRLSGVNRWFLGDHIEGKIDCKKGDLRRYRCKRFAWLCK